MKIDILTLFPDMFRGPFDASIIKRAESKNLIKISVHNLRDWGESERKNVDDRPYGGGVGMILRVDIIDKALKGIGAKSGRKSEKIILLDATGNKYNQQHAQKFAELERLTIIAGHYEGIDHRVHEQLVDEIISVGEYVLTGGEIPAMIVVDSTIRLIPGVLGKNESTLDESHKIPGYLEYPQYTRPEIYKGWEVPKILLSGNHMEIKKWKEENSRF